MSQLKQNQVTDGETVDSRWGWLYKIGGSAAMIAGVIFRRNLGPEISLFSAQKQSRHHNRLV